MAVCALTNLIVEALLVSISEQSYFARGGDDSVNLETNIMLTTSLLLVVEVVVDEFIVVVRCLS
jgi:hypothetical protein